MTRNYSNGRRIMEVKNMQRKNFVIPIAFVVMACMLLVPMVSATTYGITSSIVSDTWSPGTVSNKDNISGSSPNNAYAQITSGSPSQSGAGGQIRGYVGSVALGSNIQIYAFSPAGYSSKVHVYVSTSSGGPWNEIGTGVSVSGGPGWFNFGYCGQAFSYVAVASIHEGGQPSNVYIDCVKITQPP
jgi:ABC-type transport system involved in multi-copper enzyme maturation permease subunit